MTATLFRSLVLPVAAIVTAPRALVDGSPAGAATRPVLRPTRSCFTFLGTHSSELSLGGQEGR